MLTQSEQDELVAALSEIDPRSNIEVKQFEALYECELSCTTEKINSLQFTYYYEVYFKDDSTLFVEIESGINNGTVVNHADWEYGTFTPTKTIETLTDVVFDEAAFNNWHAVNGGNKGFLKKQAILLFQREKEAIMRAYTSQSYDNYVTGGGAIKTKKHYKDEFTRLLKTGAFWKCIYKDVEVDRSII